MEDPGAKVGQRVPRKRRTHEGCLLDGGAMRAGRRLHEQGRGRAEAREAHRPVVRGACKLVCRAMIGDEGDGDVIDGRRMDGWCNARQIMLSEAEAVARPWADHDLSVSRSLTWSSATAKCTAGLRPRDLVLRSAGGGDALAGRSAS